MTHSSTSLPPTPGPQGQPVLTQAIGSPPPSDRPLLFLQAPRLTPASSPPPASSTGNLGPLCWSALTQGTPTVLPRLIPHCPRPRHCSWAGVQPCLEGTCAPASRRGLPSTSHQPAGGRHHQLHPSLRLHCTPQLLPISPRPGQEPGAPPLAPNPGSTTSDTPLLSLPPAPHPVPREPA